MTDWEQVLHNNIEELKNLVFQYNTLNSKEALGKIYFCLVAIEKILNKK